MNVEMSPQINELALALAKAQGEILPALKDTVNPFFKSKYADLSSCITSCRPALAKYGLAVTQFPTSIDNKLALVTILTHSSGQYISAPFPITPDKTGIQALGAAITYVRRYCLSSVVGITQEDDDANSASNNNAKQSPSVVEKIQPDLIKELDVAVLEKTIAKIPGYKDKLLSYLFTAHGIKDFRYLPRQLFDGIMSDLKKHMYAQKEKTELTEAVVNA